MCVKNIERKKRRFKNKKHREASGARPSGQRPKWSAGSPKRAQDSSPQPQRARNATRLLIARAGQRVRLLGQA